MGYLMLAPFSFRNNVRHNETRQLVSLRWSKCVVKAGGQYIEDPGHHIQAAGAIGRQVIQPVYRYRQPGEHGFKQHSYSTQIRRKNVHQSTAKLDLLQYRLDDMVESQIFRTTQWNRSG